MSVWGFLVLLFDIKINVGQTSHSFEYIISFVEKCKWSFNENLRHYNFIHNQGWKEIILILSVNTYILPMLSLTHTHTHTHT